MEQILAEWPRLLAMGILIVLSALFSGSETAFFSLPRARIRRLREERTASAALVVRLVSSPRRLLVSILLGNLAVNIAYFSVSLEISTAISEAGKDTLAVGIGVVSLLVLILLGEFIPKGAALGHPVRFARLVAAPLLLFELVILPVRFVLDELVGLLSRVIAGRDVVRPYVTSDELKAFVRLSGAAGRIGTEERELLEEVIDFGEIRVREVMVPRVDMVAVDLSEGREAVRRLAREHRVSKIIVYEESRDQVRGYVAVKDLLYHPEKPLADLVRQVLAVPETKTVDSLLREFRARKEPIALVVDEYGGTEGIVTPEDLVEEIVGEIGDEYDSEAGLIRRVREGTYVIAGELSVREWEEWTGEALPAGKYDTVGGYVMATLDRVPGPGDVAEAPGRRLTVLSTERGRIVAMLVTRAPGGGS